ncbi:primase alpha helix C-terminal domain-containing protein [Staphylococcus massiliensis]|uniref:primase alpha helix C-terminal domain-containing protein n=1 Tax=Staphylococcus massiliensis TaxID=555791 RepID=UPI001EDD13A8|nr:primase alpha helix C-terminal domain-containing protein [Staphylococcus massiliensis]MCG3401714.1 primase alpha helix C-terminal domain-containing protein [Staphylococcus massiliensis]
MIELDNDTPVEYTVFKNQYEAKPLQHVNGGFSKLLTYLEKAKIGEKNSNYCIVGGHVKDHRNNENTVTRSIITIDYDDIPAYISFPDEVSGALECGYALYSTHNHKPDAPRFRLFIPLDRSYELTPDEYRACIQYITKNLLEMDYYDPQSEVISQVMFLPTVSEDNQDDYIFSYVDEEPLNLEPILSVAEVQRSITNKPLVTDELWEEIAVGLNEGESIGRNSAMTKIVGHLLQKNVNPTLAYYLALHWDEQNNPSLYDTGEFDRTFYSIYNKDMKGG